MLRSPTDSQSDPLTESRVAEQLGIDRLELYLVAAAEKRGRYDPLTHLLTFRDEDVDAMARRLGVTRRRGVEASEEQRRAIPEPTGE